MVLSSKALSSAFETTAAITTPLFLTSQLNTLLPAEMKSILNPFCSSHAQQVPQSSPSDPPPAYENRSPNNLAILELFQSQGCNSCPPSNANLIAMTSNDPSLLLLTYEVTYWDHLGWQDTFGQSEFDRRQWDYARRLGRKSVFTPQIIVNGAADGVGNSKRDLEEIVKKGITDGPTGSIRIQLQDSDILVESEGPASRLSVQLVRYDPRTHDVAIRRGESSGKCLPYRNVVKDVTVLGAWYGGEAKFEAKGLVQQGAQADLESVVLVQDGFGGRIVGAAKI